MLRDKALGPENTKTKLSQTAMLVGLLIFAMVTAILAVDMYSQRRISTVTDAWEAYANESAEVTRELWVLNANIGRGGFALTFNDFLQYGDHSYADKARQSLERARSATTTLLTILSDTGLRGHLNTISRTIAEYEAHLDLAVAKKRSFTDEEWDRLAAFDDDAAARTLTLISQITNARYEEALRINAERSHDARSLTTLTLASGLVSFTLYVAVFWLFRRHLTLGAETQVNLRQLNEVFDRHPDGLLVVDDDGKITRSNPVACEILGYETGELNRQAVDSLVPMHARYHHAAWRNDYVREGNSRKMANGRPLKAVRKDGSQIDVEVSLSRIPTSTGHATIVACRDITASLQKSADLEKALIEAEQASESKTRFLATMSHELRTPLNAIIGFSELLSQNAGNSAPTSDKYADYISKAGHHLLSIVNDILDFARVRNGELTFCKDPVYLQSVVDQALSGFSQPASEKGIGFSVNTAPDLPVCVLSDATRINQILINLIGNAIKFTSEGDVTLSISSQKQEGRLCQLYFTVKDTGVGIAPGRIDQIFDPFTQADPTITREYGGTGLGLAISSNLARAMGGNITVESAPGVGSTFRADIIVEDISDLQKAMMDVEKAAIDQDAANLRGRVLVVDDVESNAMTIMAFFEPTGIEVVWVDNGRDAIERIAREHFDLVLMDIHMPGMSGEDVASEIRAREQNSGHHLPIYAWTADALRDHQAGRGTVWDGVLTKPTLPEQVFKLVKQNITMH